MLGVLHVFFVLLLNVADSQLPDSPQMRFVQPIFISHFRESCLIQFVPVVHQLVLDSHDLWPLFMDAGGQYGVGRMQLFEWSDVLDLFLLRFDQV